MEADFVSRSAAAERRKITQIVIKLSINLRVFSVKICVTFF